MTTTEQRPVQTTAEKRLARSLALRQLRLAIRTEQAIKKL